jgi:hypothetical protein
MRRLLIILGIAMLPSIALAHGGGGGGHGGGGHMGGGGMSGGHMGGGWSGRQMSSAGMGSRASIGAARTGGWTGRSAWGGGQFHGHGRFVHHHGRVFVGSGPWWVGGYDNYWQWVPTALGVRRVWDCR